MLCPSLSASSRGRSSDYLLGPFYVEDEENETKTHSDCQGQDWSPCSPLLAIDGVSAVLMYIVSFYPPNTPVQ